MRLRGRRVLLIKKYRDTKRITTPYHKKKNITEGQLGLRVTTSKLL